MPNSLTQSSATPRLDFCGHPIGQLTEIPHLLPGTELGDEIDQDIQALADSVKNPAVSQYQPAITAVHSTSRGIAQRLVGIVTGREHHLLSRHERSLALAADFDRRTQNIREQFELPISLTLVLARATGIHHPWHDGVPSALTVDFLFTLASAEGSRFVAADFKMHKHLSDRVVQKLQLAALALSLVGVAHLTVTERDIPERLARNTRWLRVHRLPVDDPPLPEMVITRVEPLLRNRLQDGRAEIFQAASAVGQLTGVPVPVLCRTCFWLAANRWPVDLRETIGPDYPLRFAGNEN